MVKPKIMDECERCGINVSSYEKTYSLNEFNKVLCVVCQKKERREVSVDIVTKEGVKSSLPKPGGRR